MSPALLSITSSCMRTSILNHVTDSSRGGRGRDEIAFSKSMKAALTNSIDCAISLKCNYNVKPKTHTQKNIPKKVCIIMLFQSTKEKTVCEYWDTNNIPLICHSALAVSKLTILSYNISVVIFVFIIN